MHASTIFLCFFLIQVITAHSMELILIWVSESWFKNHKILFSSHFYQINSQHVSITIHSNVDINITCEMLDRGYRSRRISGKNSIFILTQFQPWLGIRFVNWYQICNKITPPIYKSYTYITFSLLVLLNTDRGHMLLTLKSVQLRDMPNALPTNPRLQLLCALILRKQAPSTPSHF